MADDKQTDIQARSEAKAAEPSVQISDEELDVVVGGLLATAGTAAGDGTVCVSRT